MAMTTAAASNPNWYPKTREEIDEYMRDNIKLVHAMLKRFKGCDDYEDLFQEACIGFYKGIKTYNPKKGVKLSTYAFECASNEIKMLLRKNSSKSRSGLVLSLDFSTPESDGGERDSLLNQNLSENDSLHPIYDSLETMICRKDIAQQALAIVDSEMTYEQRVVIHRFMEGVPQAETALELNSSQANVSKIQKMAFCELIVKLQNRGIISPDESYE